MLCFAAQKKNVMCKYEDLGAFWLDTTIFTFTWSMSAVEYVRRARTNLVRTLKGLTTVIVENLYQRGVFSEEEVSKINTERDDFDKNRGIVDTVIKGGEAACYEFLRIIDITRKRSTERPPSFLENTDSNSSSRDKFDLSYWISCFSFKEDTNMDVTYLQGPSPCHRYQQKLKSKAQKISERSWTQSKAVLFNKETSLSYSSLVLDTQGQASASKIKKSKIKKSRKVRTKKLKAHIPEDKQETSPSELLKTYERKILLVGKPGIGKTAVVHQMLKLWSEKDNKDIDYMFYFDMRETPNITEVHKLKDLLFCKFSEPDEGKDKVLEDLKNNADSVTIIFDGVADVPSSSTQSVVLELIQKTLLPEAKIIITCRPEVESADFLLDWDCLRVEVKGFSEQGIREYLSKNLSEEHFSKVLCNLELFSLCHVPMYALMVVACFSFEGTVFCPHPCTVTEIYLNILHFCNQRNVGKTSENEAVQCNAILSLAEAAFYATKGKNVNLTSLTQIDRCANLGFMNKLLIQAGPVQKKPLCAFLHYTIQEVFAALWLLKDPERIRSVVQQCLTDDIKHMKHLVPFLCGLLNEKNMDLLQFLFTSQHLRETSGWFFKHLVTTFVDCSDTEDCEIDLLFLCQCLYESQSAEACVYLLDKLDYSLDLSGETLNPQQCYAVSYIISQSKERKIQLNLEDTTVSKQGVRPLLGCLSKLQRTDFLSWQLWTICLLSEVEVDYISLLCFAENQLHLSVNSQTQLYDRAGKVLQKSAEKVKVCLHWDHRSSVYQSVSKFLLLCLPNIHSLSVDTKTSDEAVRFFVNLFCAAAEREQQTGEKILELLSSVCTYQTFPYGNINLSDYGKKCQSDFLLDLYSKVKDCEAKTGLSVLPSLQSVFQSAPAVWFINLSERTTSILLEVLKLQPEKKQVELTQYTHKKSKIRSFLQCLPYISQLSVDSLGPRLHEAVRFFVNLFCAAAEREQQTGEKILELLSSVCRCHNFPYVNTNLTDYGKKCQSDFLLDLYSKVKDCESKTGLSVLPSLQSVFQSAPAVWSINLSERKTSILLEVLKLQPEKKQVELTQYTHKKSKIRSFLQCLPYISQLSVDTKTSDEDRTKFFVNLFCAAAEREQQTGEKILELLSSVCTYQTFPFNERCKDDDDDMKKRQCDHLLDLYSKVKDCEAKTGLSVLPSLQSVFQSAPAVWFINLSERKTSILLEVLKLQPEKKQVELTQYTHKKSKIRSFLQCLPYISQLSVYFEDPDEEIRFFVNLFCAAAEREQQTGETILELLSSVCTFNMFPFDGYDDDLDKYRCDLLLDMCSDVKDCETKTGLSVLPSLQSVFQSAPAVWFINLSERKTSILLEVLKLQPEKKQVELTQYTHKKSKIRSFLQCLPYISQLSYSVYPDWTDPFEGARFFVNLFCAAAEREQQTGETILELLSSVCTYQTFPVNDIFINDCYRSDFLLDLYCHVKDYETKTGLSVLPSIQSVFQSAPAVWSINFIYTNFSILLEVLKLQSEKKQVELREWPEEEEEEDSVLRSFLQCLPYISQLSCDPDFFQSVCTSMSVRSREEAQQLKSLLQLLGFQLLLTGELHRKSCWSVGRVLKLCSSKVDLILTPSKMSARGAALLFRHTTQLHSLRLSIDMSLLLFQWVRRGRVVCPLAVEELSLVPKKARPSHRVMLRAVSSLASLLRYWTVARLDLTETCIPAQGLITLLLHDGPLTVKLSEESFQQLLCLLHEIQDKDLTLSFLSKVGGDLTSCCLNWELLHYLLQQSSAQTITVDLRKNFFLQEETTRLLPFLDRIVFKRPSPSFVMSSIRELYRAHDSHAVPSLLRSFGHVINLSSRELDSVDCAALIFILKHGDGVKLNLLWTSIPAEGVESILFMLDKVSHLSVDRNQLLRFIHCCAACDVQQEAASGLLRTLQHSLDLSCSSCVELPEEDQPEPLSLTADDCRAVSTILTHSSRDTQLDLRDCEVEDSVLDLLFPVLHRVRLRVSKTVLLQLLSLVPVNSERDTVRRAVSLCGALGGELDLSHSTLDQRACGALVQMLDSCEGLTELDLSHCQLTDQLLLPLITHLHKVQVLDLSHNQITDASTDVLLQLLSINPSIDCVRLYSNNIVHRAAFKEHKQFEVW
ncbi:uncharacterized protein LOC102081515 isoform X13 [Oreochromis niloticus]|uniref:uncharacterized protein LOC102081515 isoform X13 n=1 Tax=Oreochromis niloticus TaxID=8128 RepID=UPI000DF29E75|nr:uncharacterized protein LOC102081515 isoform X13 [Oreochromis niloticus]